MLQDLPTFTPGVSESFLLGVPVGSEAQKVFKVFRGISCYLKRGPSFPNLYLNC